MLFPAMRDLLPALLMVALFLVFLYLAVEVLKRAEARAAVRKGQRAERSRGGQATHLAPLQTKLQTIKADFGAASHERGVRANAKSSLVAHARQKLRHGRFFQHHPALDESEPKAH